MAKDIPKSVLVIGRKFSKEYDAQLQRNTGKTPLEAAQQFVEDQMDVYKSNPDIVYWEGHNEPVWNTNEEMAWYAQAEVERMKLMAKEGLKCVIGNFATGTPDLALWPAFFPAFEAALEYGAILGLHEYSCPWMWWMTGKHQLDPNSDEGDEGWTTLRYRKIYRQHLIPNGFGKVPLAITETGIDPLVNPKPKEAGKGGTWQGLGSFWKKHDNESDKDDYYVRQLIWYDKELQKDDYVAGATIFTWGSFGNPWAKFDVAGTAVADKLIEYAKTDPAKPFVPGKITTRPPEPPTIEPPEQVEPSVSRGLPREQYTRTYVLLPPNADAAWARAAVEGMWDKARFTVGNSADDAGIGDLDVRRVLAVNPQAWPGPQSLADFYKQYYPGVQYEPITAATPTELKQKLANK
jgi:hypothetical protein